jgi:hypothetical protein
MARPVLLRGGGLRLGLFRSHFTAKSLGICPSPDAICLRVLDRGRVTLNPYAKGYTEVQCLFVCEPELPRELVNPDLLGHLLLGSFFRLYHLPAGTSSHTCFEAHKPFTGLPPAQGHSRTAATRAPAAQRRARRPPRAEPSRALPCARPLLRNSSTPYTTRPLALAGRVLLRTHLTSRVRPYIARSTSPPSCIPRTSGGGLCRLPLVACGLAHRSFGDRLRRLGYRRKPVRSRCVDGVRRLS